MIKAVTFDLWDTVLIDDSDEAKRKQAGRPSKAVERRQWVERFVAAKGGVSREVVDRVYDTADAAFRKVWHDSHVTWSVQERLQILLKGLGRELPEAEMAELVRLHEEMELEFRPDFVPGVHEALRELKKTHRLGVISDAIFSPGRVLRQLLADEGLADLFDVFIFSDEMGFSKPHPEVYAAACRALDCEPAEIAHIGDREHNDILGAKKAGFATVLCLAVLDRGSDHTQADAKLYRYSQLTDIIATLSKT
ncbi:HAD family hydrolase [candidate division KSB1 bacterium]|nr:HAD family hydrolase [candidate division KSB1 bacterium]